MTSSHFSAPGAACLLLALASLAGCLGNEPHTLVTIADARADGAELVDTGGSGDTVGDIVVFDQPLLDEHGQRIGNNSGSCIRTRPAHSYQCQWTLTLQDGSIQVAGREFEHGASPIAIVGGTGRYAGIRGEMQSLNNEDGTFTQTLRYRIDR